MTLIPHFSDLSLYRHYAGQLRAGTVPVDPAGFGECVEDLCNEIEQMRGCVAELVEQKQFQEHRCSALSAKIARAESGPMDLWRHVQQIHRRHESELLTQEECMERVLRLVRIWAEYKTL